MLCACPAYCAGFSTGGGPPSPLPAEASETLNGAFPALKSGANVISWNGTVTKAVIRPNRRYLQQQ